MIAASDDRRGVVGHALRLARLEQQLRARATTLPSEVSFTTSSVLESRSGSTLRTACGSTT